MPFIFTENRSMNENKQISRKKVADAIIAKYKQLKPKGIAHIHFFGGTIPHMEFEKLFLEQGKFHFWRFEKQPTEIPKRYTRTQLFLEDPNLNGVFSPTTFCAHKYLLMTEIADKNDIHFVWLDFCETPNNKALHLLENIYHTDATEAVYATFYLNPRALNGRVGNIIRNPDKKKAVSGLQSYLSYHCDIWSQQLDFYKNGAAPMCVLECMQPHTVEEYVAMVNKNIPNSVIAEIWGIQPMKVAGLAAAAKRKGLI